MLRITERTKKECSQLCHLTYFFTLLNKDPQTAWILLTSYCGTGVPGMSCYLIVFTILSTWDKVHSNFLVTVVSCLMFCCNDYWGYCEVVVIGMKVELIALFHITLTTDWVHANYINFYALFMTHHAWFSSVAQVNCVILPQIKQQLLLFCILEFIYYSTLYLWYKSQIFYAPCCCNLN
jgi:hypothetical protein